MKLLITYAFPVQVGQAVHQVLAKLLCWNLFFLAYILLGGALPVASQDLNRQEVNQLVDQLSKAKSDTNTIKILIALGNFHLHKPGEFTNDLDSSLVYLQQAEKLSSSLHLLKWQHKVENILSENYLEGGNYQLAYAQLSQIISNCKRTGDKEAEANAKFSLGIYLTKSAKKHAESIITYKQAAQLYRALHMTNKEIIALESVAATHVSMGMLSLAEKEFDSLIVYSNFINYHNRLQYSYNWLASINRSKGNFDKSLLFSLRCIETMNKSRDTTWAAIFYGSLAQIYIEAGKKKEGVEWYAKSLLKWQKMKLPNLGMYIATNVIVHDLIEHHKSKQAINLIQNLVKDIPPILDIEKGYVAQIIAYCYNSSENCKAAEEYYLASLNYFAKAHYDFDISRNAQREVGKFYLQQKNFKKSEFYLKPLLRDSLHRNSISSLKDIHFMLFKIDSAKGNYLSAIHHFRLSKSLNDSIFNQTKNRQFAELEVRYQNNKNKQNIALLQKQGKLQRSELQQDKILRNSLLGGATLLLCLLGVSYNRYRLKQRSASLLEAQQAEINNKNGLLERAVAAQNILLSEKESLLKEKEWMLKEIHHRVKNNLQIIKSLLNSQADFLEDPVALVAMRESQNRVHVMALIHQKLYQSESLATVNMQMYIQDIVTYLINCFDKRTTVRQQLAITPVELNVILATPLGLIINEAVTNSLKYAFPQGQTGTITIALDNLNDQFYRLTIADDGVGINKGIDLEAVRTLGLTMIKGLSNQLDADLIITQSRGVQFCLQFAVVNEPTRANTSYT